MSIVIRDVNRMMQHGEFVYSFTLTAENVISHCRVERFGIDPEGVNRRLNEKHAMQMADAMLDHSSLWLDAILGDLSGEWVYDEVARTLTGGDESYISVDDGQHRWHALSLLNALERQHLSFTMTTTLGLPFERRLKVFRMQIKRKKLDSRLDLAQRHRIGDWNHARDQEAYELVLLLNSATTSPLKGMILLEEQEKRPHEGKHRPIGVNANGLFSTLRSVIGGKSPLNALSPEQRKKVVLNLISLSADIWRKEWCSDKHKLTTASGINAILMLVVSSPNFRGAIGDDFTQESLRKGLSLAKSMKWGTGQLKNANVREIVGRLDELIGRNAKVKAEPVEMADV